MTILQVGRVFYSQPGHAGACAKFDCVAFEILKKEPADSLSWPALTLRLTWFRAPDCNRRRLF